MRIYPELLVDQEFKSLGDQGFSGTLNDRQFAFLRSKGYTNSLADMIASWLSYSPVKLFTLSEPGIWLDPSDLTTMFQDRAGTTPVTTPGQSVGYRLDKSGNNNHATANSDAARGIYGIEPVGGRRNLLTFTEQFENAGWSKTNVTVTANTSTSPEGTITADRMTASATTSVHRVVGASVTLASGLNCAYSVYLKAGTHSFVQIHDGASVSYFANFNVSTGVVGTATGCTAAMTDVGNGWYRCSIAMTLNVANPVLCVGMVTSNTAARNESWTAAGTENILLWGAQLETGSTATAYQRVTTQYDVTEAGKQTLHYVQYDGSDDGYVTPTITAPGVDKAQVFAGLRKLSNAASGVPFELGNASNGGIALFAPFGAANNYSLRSRGTTSVDVAALGYTPPITNVVTGLGDISGDLATLRVNGAQVAQSTSDQGTGNYLAYPMYIGRRGGTTLPFNGRDYGIITRFGANLDALTIAATESWLASKTGVTL